jgi:serine/threonine protein kinase
VVIQIFSGYIPYHEITADGPLILTIISARPLRRPEGIADTMWDLIESCCQREPADRPTASEVLEVLRSQPELGVDEGTSSDWDEGFIAQLRSLAGLPDLSGASVWD